MSEEILPHLIYEKSRDETGHTHSDSEQQELFSPLIHVQGGYELEVNFGEKCQQYVVARYSAGHVESYTDS